MSENINPMGQRKSSIILLSFNSSVLPENKVQDDAANQKNDTQDSRALQKIFFVVLDFRRERVNQALEIFVGFSLPRHDGNACRQNETRGKSPDRHPKILGHFARKPLCDMHVAAFEAR